MAEDRKKEEFASRVAGWLNVWEVDSHIGSTPFRDGCIPKPIWEPHYCILQQDTHRMSHYRNEKLAREQLFGTSLDEVRLDGGKDEFDKRWGYEALDSISEMPFSTTPLDVLTKSKTIDYRSSLSRNGTTESAYEKSATLGERRGSMPVVCPDLTDDNMEPPSTPSRLASFFSRKVIKSNLKRTKSVTKLDRKRMGIASDLDSESKYLDSPLKRSMSLGRITRKLTSSRQKTPVEETPTNQHLDPSVILNSRMRASRSHESLFMSVSSMHSIDLSGPDIEIKPLHSSILGQDHCFQVSTNSGSKYYSCRTAQERQRWMQSLRRTVQPNQEQASRIDNSLQLWILEAKNVVSKKRYFCELCLDKTLYARTSSKTKGELLFWGEHFDFCNLPTIQMVTVNLYKEADKKKKKVPTATLR